MCWACYSKDANKNRVRERSSYWKGGRIINTHGYAMLRRPEHPRAQKGGYVLEHILVMEELLGRALFPGERVHHLNGVKDDNHPENLELWLVSQPPGQRVEDVLAWAEEVLDRYRPLADSSGDDRGGRAGTGQDRPAVRSEPLAPVRQDAPVG